jgi:DNA mismatch repair ATPase MutS
VTQQGEEVTHYGITLARSVGMPERVVVRAMQVAQQVEAAEAADVGQEGESGRQLAQVGDWEKKMGGGCVGGKSAACQGRLL